MSDDDRTISVPAKSKYFAMRIEADGEMHTVWLDWSGWPFEYSVDEDGPSGKRLTRRGSAIAGLHEVRVIRARGQGASRAEVLRHRALWFGDEIVEFGRRWMARERETFPHFVEKPTGTR